MLGIIAGSGWDNYLTNNPRAIACDAQAKTVGLQSGQLYELSFNVPVQRQSKNNQASDAAETGRLSAKYSAHTKDLETGRSLASLQTVYMLLRHGRSHNLPPHLIDYKLSLRALHQLGVKNIVSLNLVGAIAGDLAVADIVLPTDLIDYTHGRQSTFVTDESREFSIDAYTDFANPFDLSLLESVCRAAHTAGVAFTKGGVYGCTQGPRLETVAEIERLKRDGCTIVGMTAMPEAILAKELKIPYICLSSVVNYASGVKPFDAAARHDKVQVPLMEGIRKAMQMTQRKSIDILAALVQELR